MFVCFIITVLAPVLCWIHGFVSDSRSITTGVIRKVYWGYMISCTTPGSFPCCTPKKHGFYSPFSTVQTWDFSGLSTLTWSSCGCLSPKHCVGARVWARTEAPNWRELGAHRCVFGMWRHLSRCCWFFFYDARHLIFQRHVSLTEVRWQVLLKVYFQYWRHSWLVNLPPPIM